MTSRVPSICRACARFRPERADCEAYPGTGSIPAGIIFFGEGHLVPRAGDHEKQFLQGDTPEQRQAFQDWQTTFG